MIFDNMTLREAIKYGTCEEVAALVETRAHELDSAEEKHAAEVKALDRAVELLEEQLFFARELLCNVEERLRRCTSAKQARGAFAQECAESLFER